MIKKFTFSNKVSNLRTFLLDLCYKPMLFTAFLKGLVLGKKFSSFVNVTKGHNSFFGKRQASKSYELLIHRLLCIKPSALKVCFEQKCKVFKGKPTLNGFTWFPLSAPSVETPPKKQ